MATKLKDLTGQRFTHLTVLDIYGRNKHGHIIWNCQCDCGTIIQAYKDNLQSNKTKSCGNTKLCKYAFDLIGYIHRTHNLTSTIEYKLWKSIKFRCFNESASGFSHYGGRGITIYSLWINDFQAFYDYLQSLPETRLQFEARTGQKATIDRINVDGNYEPDNLKWSSVQEQMQNRTITVLNVELVKFILCESIINKQTLKQIQDNLLIIGYDICKSTIKSVINRKSWTNINIDKEIVEYERFDTINGIKIP